MAQPMLQIAPDTATAEEPVPLITPNLLPCRIHHTGPIGPADGYWAPKTATHVASSSSDNNGATTADDPTTDGAAANDATADHHMTAYFRGRKLHGRAVAVPAGYRGVVGVRRSSPREEAQAQVEASGGWAAVEVLDVDESAEERAATAQAYNTGTLAVAGTFSKVVVWGHQSTADAATDPYVRGLGEWVALADEVGVFTR